MADATPVVRLLRDLDCGVYAIENIGRGSFYIGSSARIALRYTQHLSDLRCGRHRNPHLQNAFRRDGQAAFRLKVLAYVGAEDLVDIEQRLLDLHVGKTECYNVAPIAQLPPPITAERRRQISEHQTGRKQSPELIEKRIAPLRGRKRPAWVVAKLGRKKGTKLPAEHIAKLKRPRNLSAESLERMAAAQRGKKQSPESIAKRNAFMHDERRAGWIAKKRANASRIWAERRAAAGDGQ